MARTLAEQGYDIKADGSMVKREEPGEPGTADASAESAETAESTPAGAFGDEAPAPVAGPDDAGAAADPDDMPIARPYVQSEPDGPAPEPDDWREDGPATAAWKMEFAEGEAAKDDSGGDSEDDGTASAASGAGTTGTPEPAAPAESGGAEEHSWFSPKSRSTASTPPPPPVPPAAPVQFGARPLPEPEEEAAPAADTPEPEPESAAESSPYDPSSTSVWAAGAAAAVPPPVLPTGEPGYGGSTGPRPAERHEPGPYEPAEHREGASARSGGTAASAAAASDVPTTGPADEPAAAASARSGGGTGGGGRPPKGPKQPKGAKPKKPKKKRALWVRITRGVLIAAGVFLLIGVGVFAVAYATIPVPSTAQAEATDQGSTFYYADGKSVFAERGVNRDPVELDEVPKEVQNAILSAEDRGFWTEPGVSVTGTLRGVWSTVAGRQVQGGSTITQQMVRNYYKGLSQEQTVSRKFKEIIISLKVDRSQSKEWVLEQYLNTIYFGRNAYGIQAASQAYYHKDVGKLTPDEASFLAAAIQQPTKFGLADATTTPEMENRWDYVVDGLVTMESITPAESDEYKFPVPKKEIPQEGVDLSGYKGYMFQQAMHELEQLGFSEDAVNRGGLKVTTTFDEDLMKAAKDAVEDNVPVDDLPKGVNAGLTAVEPSTGEVKAFYGGKDYLKNQYDSAFRGSAQAGSAFKPYVLAAALKTGYSLNSVVDGNGPQTFAGSSVQNAGGDPGGSYNLIQATMKSNNVGYVNLGQKVGLKKVVDLAHEAGIPKNKITKDQANAATLPLGVSDVSPVDQASGYSTFANKGEHIEAHVVRSVKDKAGEEQRPEVKKTRVLKEGQAADVTYALQQVVQGGTGTGAQIGRPAAGKTGTTSGSVAAWFVGFTPQLSSAVGIYNGDNQPFSVPGWGQLSGGTLPTQVWRAFMSKAMEGKKVEQFPQPTYGGDTQNWAPPPPPETEEPEADPTTQEPEPEVPPTTEPPTIPDPPVTDPPPGTGPPEPPDIGIPEGNAEGE